MSLARHSLAELFDQLGLDSSEKAIQDFICDHLIKDSSLALVDAPFWNKNQAAFIKEAWFQDSDWVSAVDELDTLLRK